MAYKGVSFDMKLINKNTSAYDLPLNAKAVNEFSPNFCRYFVSNVFAARQTVAIPNTARMIKHRGFS